MEGKEILAQEFGTEHITYFSIIEAIAAGHNTFSKISNYTKIQDSYLAKCIKDLEKKYTLITKQKPLYPNNQNIFRYIITNKFIYFWFRYAYTYRSSTNILNNDFVLKKIENEINTINGFTFENLCHEYIKNNKVFSTKYIFIGKWWDKLGEVDILLDNKEQKECCIIECKLSAKKITIVELQKTIDTANRVNSLKNRKKHFYLFCSEVITKEKQELLKKYNFKYVDGKDIFKYLK